MNTALFAYLLSSIVFASPGQWAEEMYATQTYGNRAAYYLSRAENRLKVEDVEGAIDDLSYAIDYQPNNPVLYLKRAKVRCRHGETEAAAKDLQIANSLTGKIISRPSECAPR